MKRTRVLVVVLLAVAAIAFVGCGDDDDSGSNATNTPAGQTAVVTAAPTTVCGDKTTVDSEEATVKTYDAEPAITIDAAKTYIATVKTERGDFKIKLRPDLAPHHVNSFVFLAKDGYFDHLTFHRVLPGFVAQTGDPTGAGGGGPGYLLNDEFTTAEQYTRGIVGMARTSANNSAGSQWFVTYARASNLDGAYTIFGEVTEGMDVVDCITPRDPSRDPNAAPGDKIISITIDES
jgi:cyclophilin family peptidyl-prolyl cis-trans isomerase